MKLSYYIRREEGLLPSSEYSRRRGGTTGSKLFVQKMFLASLLLFLWIGDAAAQGCAVCTKVGAGLDDKSAKGLNAGIIYLAFLPLAILGTLTFLWWRSNKSAI